MVDGTGLENRRAERYREFESRPLRQRKQESQDSCFLWRNRRGLELAGFAEQNDREFGAVSEAKESAEGIFLSE